MNWRIRTLCLAILIAIFAVGCAAREAKKTEEPQKAAEAQIPVTEHKWEQYNKDHQGVTYFYEKDTIVYGTDGTLKVWRKREFPIRSKFKAIVNLDEIDCFKQKHRSHQIQVISWEDSVETFSRVAEWSTIYGDSAEEFFLDESCKEFRKKK